MLVTATNSQPTSVHANDIDAENRQTTDVEYDFEKKPKTVITDGSIELQMQVVASSQDNLVDDSAEETSSTLSNADSISNDGEAKPAKKDDQPANNWFVSKVGVSARPKTDKANATLPSPSYIHCGEDAYFIAEQPEWNIYGTCHSNVYESLAYEGVFRYL
jgi:hypothetical protein